MMCTELTEKQRLYSKWVKELRSSMATLLHKVELEYHLVTSGWYMKNTKASSLNDVLRWKESFSHLLRSKEGRSAFHTFLQTEFSEENLEFWEACEDYKKTRWVKKLPSKAQDIFQEFLQFSSPREVNIDHRTRELIHKKMAVPCRNCFDAAQEQIRILMEKDSYPRFLKSPIYNKLLQQSPPRTVTVSFT
ncbi:regulator of G-protein signaling 21 [Xenopus laevis]|uniref:Regulator of G-protein signaling 21 n=2 Tax=Xenopus laevis TaxID=8355 RepID=A0A1L8GMM8_XENLA|nr:regulator of G-protein signaling 21 [Xenopus laevis]OCT85102.1 hypothetical protein XELAEV_18023267mg [Xenopus laevis]